MPAWKLATPEQKAQYQKASPVYGLHAVTMIPEGEERRSFDKEMKVTGKKLPVFIEDLRGSGGGGDPTWEACAPPGYMFDSNETHTILARTQKELKDYLSYETLVPCWHEGCCLPEDVDPVKEIFESFYEGGKQ